MFSFRSPSLHPSQDAMEMPPLWKSANSRGFPQGFGTLCVPHSHSDSHHHLFSPFPSERSKVGTTNRVRCIEAEIPRSTGTWRCESRETGHMSNPGSVLSVNVGSIRTFDYRGRPATSAIWKSPVEGRLVARGVNLEGETTRRTGRPTEVRTRRSTPTREKTPSGGRPPSAGDSSTASSGKTSPPSAST